MKRLSKITSIFISSVFILAMVALPVMAAVRTQTVWTVTGSTGGLVVIPYVRIDDKAFFIDFEHDDFDNVDYVSYNLNYDTDEEAVKRGVEGLFYPQITQPSGNYDGNDYIRRELVLGTCSRNECDYYSNPRNATLTVNTKLLEGKILDHTQVISIPNDQF